MYIQILIINQKMIAAGARWVDTVKVDVVSLQDKEYDDFPRGLLCEGAVFVRLAGFCSDESCR